jgi:hypothetical protein
VAARLMGKPFGHLNPYRILNLQFKKYPQAIFNLCHRSS